MDELLLDEELLDEELLDDELELELELEDELLDADELDELEPGPPHAASVRTSGARNAMQMRRANPPVDDCGTVDIVEPPNL